MSEEYTYWKVESGEKERNIVLIDKLAGCEEEGNKLETLTDERGELTDERGELTDERDKLTEARDKLTEARDKLKILTKAREDLKQEMGKGEDRSTQYYVKDSEYRNTKEQLSKLEEQIMVLERNKGLKLKIERLKDIYSRKENVRVTLVINGIEDARIVSTSAAIKNDILQLEEYGIYLTLPYYNELAKIIKKIYFELAVVEQEFTENNIPSETVKAIVRMCKSNLREYQNDGKDKTADKDKEIREDADCYNIPTSVFRKWYLDSAFRRFSLTSIKEALINFGYAKANPGRNDRTVAGMGKAVSLYKAAIEKVEDDEQ